jgi:hypothetical protein
LKAAIQIPEEIQIPITTEFKEICKEKLSNLFCIISPYNSIDLFPMFKIISIFTFLVSLVGLYSCSDIKYENYFLPENFTGNVVVIYKNDGNTPKDTNNYLIPASGILYSSNKFVSGDFIIKYYQKRGNNVYDTLFELVPGKPANRQTNQIVFPRILTFQNYKSEPSYTVSTFYVGRKTANELAKDRFIFEKNLEELLLK